MTSPAESSTRPVAPVYGNVIEMIGQTPMLELKRLDTGPCRLFAKLESQNPGNSIKDRIAISMIDAAERDGRLRPGGRIVEGTAGNTGIALALVAAQRGYTLTVVVPDKMSAGKISHLRAMGAEVLLTRSDVEKGHPEYYQDMAARIADESDNAIFINQFANDANPQAHYDTTGPEIWDQMDGRVDAFVAGVGSGGTMSGCGRFFREKNPDIELILADPEGSILAPLINEGRRITPGSWLVEGMGEDFVPDICDLDLIDKAYAIPDAEAFHAARDLLRTEGILGGSSTGCLIAAAQRYCLEQTEPKRVATFVCDHGAKYTDKMYNDYWMIDQGFIERKQYGDLRDLIARRHAEGEDITIQPHTPLLQVYKTMRLYDVSQMVVVDKDDHAIGIIDESDLLLAVTRNPDAWQHPVSEFMESRLETVPPTASINDLIPIFRADHVAIVTDEKFHGLITRIDLLTYLRNQTF